MESTSSGTGPFRGDGEETLREIETFLETWFQAYESADVEAMVAMSVPSGLVSLGSGEEELFLSREDLHAAMTQDMDQRSGCVVENRKTYIRGENGCGFALATGDYCWEIEGKPLRVTGRRSFVLRRMEGRWYITHMHFSFPALGQEIGSSYPNLRPLLKRYSLLEESARDIILFVRRRDGKIIEANRAAAREYGYSQEALLAISLEELLVKPSPSEILCRENEAFLEVHCATRTGNLFVGEMTVQHVSGEEGEPLCLVMVRNISERKEMERQLYLAATRDHLTGALNRQYFEKCLLGMIEAKGLSRKALTLALFDVDCFKKINDTWGHLEGDKVLAGLSGMVEDFFPGEDVVFARWGGDEFMLLADSPPRTFCSRLEVFRKFLSEKRFLPHVEITLSFGVVAHGGGESPEALIHRADEALYCAKREGRDRICFRE